MKFVIYIYLFKGSFLVGSFSQLSKPLLKVHFAPVAMSNDDQETVSEAYAKVGQWLKEGLLKNLGSNEGMWQQPHLSLTE
jgi:hypothetical protein